jgi:hypothetical protein
MELPSALTTSKSIAILGAEAQWQDALDPTSIPRVRKARLFLIWLRSTLQTLQQDLLQRLSLRSAGRPLMTAVLPSVV